MESAEAQDQVGEVRSHPGDGRSVLAPYRQDLFLEHSGWRALGQILRDSGGGSYGLTGSRGSGKTWLMDHVRKQTENKDGIAVWFPSPSEYEPIAFLAALSDVVAGSFERYYDRRGGRATLLARRRSMLLAFAGAILVYLALAIIISGFNHQLSSSELFSWLKPRTLTVIALIAAGGVLLVRSARQRRGPGAGLARVRDEAEELRRKIRFTLSSTESEEFGLAASFRALGASLKQVSGHRFDERPATLSSLVHSFRGFVAAMAEAVPGPVVVAIDELDKMSDPARVAGLFRDIKGIFEIPGAYFLVSLSDEAARALDLGALRTRNEFNSSFYTVINLPPLAPKQCLELLRRRDPSFGAEAGTALAILTGGVPRELVRLGEVVRLRVGRSANTEEVVQVVLEQELHAFSGQLVGGFDGEDLGVEEARLAAFVATERLSKTLDEGGIAPLVQEFWDLNRGLPAWDGELREEWQRLLVRMEIGDKLMRSPISERRAIELQRISATASGSAAIARWQLDPEQLFENQGVTNGVGDRGATTGRNKVGGGTGAGRIRDGLSAIGRISSTVRGVAPSS